MVVQLIIFPSIFNLNGMHHGAASVIKNRRFQCNKICIPKSRRGFIIVLVCE